MRNYPPESYTTLNGADMGASVSGAWIDTYEQPLTSLGFQINYTNTNTPVGTFIVQLTNDTSVTAIDGTTSNGLAIAVDSTLTAGFDLTSMPNYRYLRVRYVRTSGGSGATITASLVKTPKV